MTTLEAHTLPVRTASAAVHSYRTPLLWILGCIVFGYALERYCGAWITTEGLRWSIAGMLGLTLISWILGWMRYLVRMQCCIVLLGTLLSCAYVHRDVAVETVMPPREIICEVVLERLFDSKAEGRWIGGYGCIGLQPGYWAYLSNRRVYLSASVAMDAGSIVRGDTVKVRGVLRQIEAPTLKTKPFDAFLWHSGIHYKLEQAKVLERVSQGHPLNQLWERWNRLLYERLQVGVADTAESGVYTAMLLGKKSGLKPEQKQKFVESGTMHLFAISGLHVGVVASSVLVVLGYLRLPKVAVGVLGLSAVYLYVLVTGNAPSAQRAFCMVAFIWIARALQRQGGTFQGLVASAIWMLLWKPYELWNVGFQLSYAAVTGIILYGVSLSRLVSERYCRLAQHYNPEKERWKYAYERILEGIVMAGCVSLGASLACASLCIEHFYVLSVGGVLMNIVMVQAAAIVMMMGFTVMVLGEWAGEWLNPIACYCIYWMESVIGWSTQLPGFCMHLRWSIPGSGLVLTVITLSLMATIQNVRSLQKNLGAYGSLLGVMVCMYGVARSLGV